MFAISCVLEITCYAMAGLGLIVGGKGVLFFILCAVALRMTRRA